MKALVDIPDNDAAFAMKVLKSLSSVTQVKSMSLGSVKLWEDLKEAAVQVLLA